MIEPYQALGLVPTMRGIRHRDDIAVNPRAPLAVEHSMTPHNVWDRWIELYGRCLEAYYPVADTAIGRLGFLMANEGSHPENARGLAMNGAG